MEEERRLRKDSVQENKQKVAVGNGHGPARHGGRDAAGGWLILRE